MNRVGVTKTRAVGLALVCASCSGNTDGPGVPFGARRDTGTELQAPPKDASDASDVSDGELSTDVLSGDLGDLGAALPPSFSAAFDPGFGAMTNDPRTIQVSISSEVLGQRGFAYTATPAPGDIVFVDGWELRFERILTTVANLRINLPGASPADQGMVGASVATRTTAFAVDLHTPGPLVGASGAPETAIPLAVVRSSDAGGALNPMLRYAFSYDTVAAVATATNVNLDPGEYNDYREMISRRWSHLYVGIATYRGAPPAEASVFASYPTTVRFRLGFGAPAQYVNCYNPDNGGDAMPGVAPSATGRARAQISVHMDHAFWGALNTEDPPLHFDHFASRARASGAQGEVSLEDLLGVVPTNLRDLRSRQVPDRGGQTRGYSPRDPLALSFEPNGASGVRDLRDFVAFSARASSHFNADGLCYVRPTGELRY